MATETKPEELTSFSLQCDDCDAGMEFETQAEAEAAGWTDVFDDDGLSWNQLGHCPECALQDAEEACVSYVRSYRWANEPAEAPSHLPGWVEEYRDTAKVAAELTRLGEAVKVAEARCKMLRDWRAKNPAKN